MKGSDVLCVLLKQSAQVSKHLAKTILLDVANAKPLAKVHVKLHVQ